MSEVYKMQRPVYGSEGDNEAPEILIYNKNKSRLGTFPMTKELWELFPPNVFKIFVRGHLKDKKIEIFRIVGDQDW